MAKLIKKDPKKKAFKKSKTALFKVQDLKVIGALILVFITIFFYNVFFKSNVLIKSEKCYIFIPSKCSTEQLIILLKQKKILNNGFSFSTLAGWLDFTPPSKGLYILKKGWNNYQSIRNLQSQQPIEAKEIDIPSVRQRNNLIKTIASKLNLDKDKFRKLLKDDGYLKKFGPLNKESIYCIFIPGTYYIPTNSTEENIIETMYEEYLNFWNDERLEKAEDAKLSPENAFILASIVYSETKNWEEMPMIAGVYINRLHNNMRLEADPTLVYATEDYARKRVYKNKKVLYPEYNTYTKKGLPPGPIHAPPVRAIDAVLNYEDHDYVYFCAKDDSSGCHSFAISFKEHKENANRYRQYLNLKKIF